MHVPMVSANLSNVITNKYSSSVDFYSFFYSGEVSFTYDRVFDETVTQSDIFAEISNLYKKHCMVEK